MRTSTVVFTGILAGVVQITTGFAAAISLEPRGTEQFGLYAYGETVNGLIVFAKDKEIYVGKSEQVFSTASTKSTPIVFSTENNNISGHDVIAHQTTASNAVLNPASSDNNDLVLAIPKDSSSGSSDVVLTQKTNPPADLLTGKFVLYGADVFVTDDSSSLLSDWFTTPTGDNGVYKLNWGQATGAGAIKVSLRKAAS